MGSSQMRQHGRRRSLWAFLVFATALAYPPLGVGQYKKTAPPPPQQRSAPPQQPAVRAQRPPTPPAVTRPTPGNYPTYRPAPNNPAATSNGVRGPAPSYSNGNNNSTFHPSVTNNPAVAPGAVRNPAPPSLRPGSVTTNPAVAPGAVRTPGAPSLGAGTNNYRANGALGGRPQQSPRSVTTMNLKSGGTAHLRATGQFRSIDRGGAHIVYGASGGRTVVASGAHQGYVQRPYVTSGGHTYVQRTYVVNNVTRTVSYRSYSFQGTQYYGYAPNYYYRPAYYRWAYTPWRSPVYYSWGWTPAASPWYGYYGPYFTPAPSYPSAAYWLTDYLVAADLQAAYAARTQPPPAALSGDSAIAQPDYPQSAADQPPATLGPDVKQAISAEVAEQLAKQQRDAAQDQKQTVATAGAIPANIDEAPPALDPNYRTFVVNSSLDVVSVDQECTLTPGDVITRLTDTPDKDKKVLAKVWSSKKPDCDAGRQITVAVESLQEMQNHLNEQIDSGLQQLATRQGTGGLPKAPDTTLIAGEVPPPVADASAVQTVEAQEVAADQAEKDAAVEVGGQGAS